MINFIITGLPAGNLFYWQHSGFHETLTGSYNEGFSRVWSSTINFDGVTLIKYLFIVTVDDNFLE